MPTTPMRLDMMEQRIRHLEEDWTEVYGKFRTLQMRTAKQVQRLDDSSVEEPQRAESDAGEYPSGTGPTLSSLSPRAQLIQKQILERRARMAKEGGE
jgi:hypothetical protein